MDCRGRSGQWFLGLANKTATAHLQKNAMNVSRLATRKKITDNVRHHEGVKQAELVLAFYGLGQMTEPAGEETDDR
jgi:hypothetical protein